MAVEGGSSRDLAALVVQLAGGLSQTGERYEPYRLVDADGTVVEPVASYFRDLLAAGRAESTVRSYGMDLLRWFRFLWAAGIVWDRASRVEARDFARWLQVAGKPSRPHWRVRGLAAEAGGAAPAGEPYAPSVRQRPGQPAAPAMPGPAMSAAHEPAAAHAGRPRADGAA